MVAVATGSTHIRALGWEERHAFQSRQCIDYYQQTGARADSLERGVCFFSDLLRCTWLIASVLAGSYYNIDPRRLGLALNLAFEISFCIEYLLNAANSLRNELAIMKEIEDLMGTTPQEEQRTLTPGPDHFQVNGEIQMRNASLGYE